MKIRARGHSDRLRCPFCLDRLGSVPHAARCPDCSAQVHRSCAREWSSCATLGCEAQFRSNRDGKLVAVGRRSHVRGERLDQFLWLIVALLASTPAVYLFWSVFESAPLRWLACAASTAAAWLLLGFVRERPRD